MTADELKKLDDAIAHLRAEREKITTEMIKMDVRAKALSKEIREREAGMPSDKQRRGIILQAQAGTVSVKPGR